MAGYNHSQRRMRFEGTLSRYLTPAQWEGIAAPIKKFGACNKEDVTLLLEVLSRLEVYSIQDQSDEIGRSVYFPTRAVIRLHWTVLRGPLVAEFWPVLIHEVCHIVDFMRTGTMTHGESWQTLMGFFDQDVDPYHDYGVLPQEKVTCHDAK